VNVGQMSCEDAVDELVGEVGEDEAALGLLRVVDGLHEAEDASVQRVDGEAHHAQTALTVAPRHVRQLLPTHARYLQHAANTTVLLN